MDLFEIQQQRSGGKVIRTGAESTSIADDEAPAFSAVNGRVGTLALPALPRHASSIGKH
jgi:hypothetical protein